MSSERIVQGDFMNVKSFQDMIDEELAGGQIKLNWKTFLQLLYGLYCQSVENIVESKEEIIHLHDVVRFKKILQVLCETSPETFVSAMWWTAIDTLMYQSSNPFYHYREIHESYHPTFLPIDRKTKCLNWIRRHFPLFVAHVLAIEEDSSTIKTEMEEMVTNIKTSFSNNLRKLRWISWKTRSLALKKIRNMKFIIGYTDSILESSSLANAYGTTHVSYTNFLTVLCDLFKKERRNNLLLLFPSDTPFDDVLNYGAVGVQIAYGMARAYDHFWTKSSTKKLVECFETTFGTLSLNVIKRCVDGELTLFSNIADAIGFKVSMDAYKMRAKEKGYEQTLKVYKLKDDNQIRKEAITDFWNKVAKSYNDDKPNNGDESSNNVENDEQSPNEEENNEECFIEEEKDEQLFIRAFANSLCEAGSKQYYRKRSESDETPLNRARVNGVLMNTSIFARKWKCGHDKWMNPQQKCRIWN